MDRIQAQLVAAGLDLECIDPDDLAGVDEFHLGGRVATNELLKSFVVPDNTSPDASPILDIGSGIGGAARTIAVATGRHVTGIDLTPAFVATATRLSDLVGLSDRTLFRVGDATQLEFGDASFGSATLLHVGMNIEDKLSAFRELARVLAPGGSLHVYDIMRIGPGDLAFPVPWSSHAETSFVETPDRYLETLRQAGFSPGEPSDHRDLISASVAAAQDNPPAVNLSHLMGPGWPEMFSNLRALLGAGILAPVEIVAVLATD